jgi:hypothetical protein
LKISIELSKDHFRLGMALACWLIITMCGLKIATDQQRTVSDLIGETRWTDSAYISHFDNAITISNNARISQWPFGHDVRLYADYKGTLHATHYPKSVTYQPIIN